ncbi:MAG: hypothetical protein KDI64_21195, partial [Candidatus Accumulibacter sp.]|nr:hypothetical protein [Accumulibacter sp.]
KHLHTGLRSLRQPRDGMTGTLLAPGVSTTRLDSITPQSAQFAPTNALAAAGAGLLLESGP